jgi:predicted ATPase
LSSGEQHLIVLLGKLLFGTEKGSLVLIDEPEISLHPYWLERIAAIFENIQNLRDFKLVVATHSPSLVENRLENVIELAEQVNCNA